VTPDPATIRLGCEATPSNSAAMEGLLTTASVPEADRLNFWREVVCHTIAGVEATPLAEQNAYAGAIRTRSIPLARRESFDLLHVEADPQSVRRTRQLISAQTEGSWLLMIQRQGCCTIRQGTEQATLLPGDIGFLDTTRPYEVVFPQRFGQSIVKMPMPLFDDLFSNNRDIAGTSMPGGKALTAIARHNLILLENFASEIEPRLIPTVADRAMDYLSLAVRARFEDGGRHTRSAVAAFHFERAVLYVAEHLADPLLCVEKIARATGLSSGHLQEIFHIRAGTTIAEYVRQQRLARCRRDLADPSLVDASITAIAFRWGFSESSSFSRAFRNAFQTSPRRYRQASRSGRIEH
jgi:AraC-like DNA-binding protein